MNLYTCRNISLGWILRTTLARSNYTSKIYMLVGICCYNFLKPSLTLAIINLSNLANLKSDVILWLHFAVSQELKCPIIFMCSLTICVFFLMFTCLYNLPIFKIMCMCFVFFPNAYPWLWTSLVCDGEPFIRIPVNRLVLDLNVEKFSLEAGWNTG